MGPKSTRKRPKLTRNTEPRQHNPCTSAGFLRFVVTLTDHFGVKADSIVFCLSSLSAPSRRLRPEPFTDQAASCLITPSSLRTPATPGEPREQTGGSLPYVWRHPSLAPPSPRPGPCGHPSDLLRRTARPPHYVFTMPFSLLHCQWFSV